VCVVSVRPSASPVVAVVQPQTRGQGAIGSLSPRWYPSVSRLSYLLATSRTRIPLAAQILELTHRGAVPSVRGTNAVDIVARW